MFLCISRPPESSHQKSVFKCREWLKTCFDAFPGHQNQVLKKDFFNVWSGRKRVFMHLCVLPDHQNQVLKKFFFSPLEWLKLCFDAFPDHQNQVLQKLFFTSGVVKRVLCICAYFQTTRIKSLKNYCFHIWSG